MDESFSIDLRFVDPHDSVVAQATDESRLLPIVGSTMLVIHDAFSESVALPDARQVEITVEVDPFPAIRGPGLAAKGLAQPGRDDLGFQLP
jgi:hypothetical protein